MRVFGSPLRSVLCKNVQSDLSSSSQINHTCLFVAMNIRHHLFIWILQPSVRQGEHEHVMQQQSLQIFQCVLLCRVPVWSHFRRKQGDPNASLSSLIPDISKVIIMFHTTFVFCVLISEQLLAEFFILWTCVSFSSVVCTCFRCVVKRIYLLEYMCALVPGKIVRSKLLSP